MFWAPAQQVAQAALASGSLLPIATEPTVLTLNNHDSNYDLRNDLRCYLHVINDNLKHKISRTKTNGNPFLPYDQDMFVGLAGDHHVCLLNKFPVLAPHLLICSNTFIEQISPLQSLDFKAWLLGFDGEDGRENSEASEDILGFYNGGRTAGASQPHRHMQLIKTEIPLEPLIVSGNLPFKHKLYHYRQLNADTLTADYHQGMTELGLYHPEQCQPYNLLLTKRWMLLLPRATNNVNGIFANGMNYSGHFLIRNQQQIDWLSQNGPVPFLAQCSQGQQN